MSSSLKPSAKASPSTTRGSGEQSSGVTHEVALKIIAKKKVKGNEASVWGEMDVLKGLDHPNIVRFSRFSQRFLGLFFLTALIGQILRVVRVPEQVLSLFRTRSWWRAL